MLNDIIKAAQEEARGTLQEQQQPCNKFTPAEISPMTGGGIPHECQKCAGVRRFCSNCHTDHHDGGWMQCRIHTLITSTAQAAYEAGKKEERERIEAIFKENVPPHAMDLEDSVWLKRLLNKAFQHHLLWSITRPSKPS